MYEQYLDRLAQIESSNNPLAQNPKSSAKGLFQFTDKTAKQYGLDDPFDPEKSTAAAAMFTQDNFKQLSNNLGREPSYGELYLAHQQGATGATKLLSNPDALAVDVVGKDQVLNNGGNENMTAQDFANLWTGKFQDLDQIEGQQSQQNLVGDQGQDNMRAAEFDAAAILNEIGIQKKPGFDAKAILSEIGMKPKINEPIDPAGAPAGIRAAVGSALTPEERLATLRSYYPDAEPYGQDNFTFTNPDNGKKTIYNPEGIDWGDVPSIAREVVISVGGGVGAVLGGAVGAAGGGVTVPVVGAVPGAAIGATVGGGIGSGYASTAYDGLLRSLGIVSDRLTPTQKLQTTALETGLGAAGEAGGRLISGAAKYAMGGGKRLAAEMAQTFESLNIPAKASIMTGGRTMARIEKGLEQSVGGIAPIYKQAEEIVSAAHASFKDIVTKFGAPKTTQGAGGVIKEAAVGATERFQSKAAQKYEEVFSAIGETTPVDVKNLIKLRTEVYDYATKSKYLAGKYRKTLSQIDAIIGDAQNGGLEFGTFRRIRTGIREDMAKSTLASSAGSDDVLMGRVYDALTLDMSEAAQSVGGDAAKKLKDADSFYSGFMRDTAKVLDKIDKYDAEERAYKFAMSAAKDGGTTLQTLKKNFTDKEWDTIAATVLNKMGQATAGAGGEEVFSISRFSTNWNSLSKEAKKALFGSARHKDAVASLDEFVKISQSLKDVESFVNSSNTGGAISTMMLFQSLGGTLGLGAAGGAAGAAAGGPESAIYGFAGGILAPRYAAKLITSPKFIKWLGTPLGAAKTSISGHVARLYAIAEEEPDLREAIFEYSKILEENTK